MDFGVRVAVFVRRGDSVLLVRHEKPGREPYYVLPGGRLEPGETIPECAVREMKEETGLSVVFAGVLYVNEFLRGGEGEDEGRRHTVDITVSATPRDDREAKLGSDPEVKPGEASTLSGVAWVPLGGLPSVVLLPEQIRKRISSDAIKEPSATEDIYLGVGRG